MEENTTPMQTGEMRINNLDAKTTWGVGLEPEGWEALMAFPSMRKPATTVNAATGATQILGCTYNNGTAERDLSITMHMTAPSRSAYLTQYEAFKNMLVNNNGVISIAICPMTGVVYSYTLHYESCQTFKQFLDGMAKFVLTCWEEPGGTTTVNAPQSGSSSSSSEE